MKKNNLVLISLLFPFIIFAQGEKGIKSILSNGQYGFSYPSVYDKNDFDRIRYNEFDKEGRIVLTKFSDYKGRNDKTITTYFKNCKSYVREEYQGSLKVGYEKEEYDNNNKLILWERNFDNGKGYSYFDKDIYKRDIEGDLIEIVSESSSGESTITKYFEKINNLKKVEKRSVTGSLIDIWEYKYDDTGKHSKTIFRNPKNNSIVEVIDFKYDLNGTHVITTEKNISKGEITYKELNRDGEVIYRKTETLDGTLLKESRTKYNSMSLPIIYYDNDGGNKRLTEIEYDNYGNIQKEILYIDDLMYSIQEYIYKYDSRGNWISKEIIDTIQVNESSTYGNRRKGHKTYNFEIREITYY